METAQHKKRILMLLENCGMPDDSRVRNEAIALVENGFDVTVICPRDPKQRWHEVFSGVRLYRYPSPLEFDGFLGYIWEFGLSLILAFVYSLYVFFRRGFDAIHVHSPPDMNCLVAIFFKIFARTKYVLDTHDLSPELYHAQKNGSPNKMVIGALRWFERRAVQWADRCIATNETQRGVHIERGGARPAHCHVVRNGPAPSFMTLANPTDSIPNDGRTVFGYVGMIGVQDGVDFMIRALHYLREDCHRDDFLGVIIGDGPALQGLKDLSAKLQVDDNLMFTGLIPYEEVPAHIAAFDVCVTPDPSNAYNDSCTTIKTIEYMAQSRPTVAFETPENQVTAQLAAIYAPDNDERKLADCMLQLMESPEQQKTMGEFGRARVVETLSWKHQETELIRLYHLLFEQTAELQSPDTKTEVDASAPKRTSQLPEASQYGTHVIEAAIKKTLRKVQLES